MDCSKCYRTLHECRDCQGQTATSIGGWKLTCSTCDSTGLICTEHGGYWQ